MKYLALTLSVAAILIAGYLYFTSSDVPEVEPLSISDEMINQVPPFRNAITLDIPDSLDFAGERVPLEQPDVKERLDRELHINTYWHNNTIFLIKRANRWLPQMEPIFEEYGIPEDLLYITVIESNLLNDTSPAGAVGFWQFLRPTAKEYGLVVDRDVDERYNPIKSTEAAAQYLRKAYDKFGNWALAVASYNRGMAGVQRAIDKQGIDNYYDLYLNDQTARYVFRVIAIKAIIKDPAKYGFEIEPEHLYQAEPLQYVEVSESIPDLVAWSKEQGINYKLLKRHNPWLRDDQLRLRSGQSFEIALPVELVGEE